MSRALIIDDDPAICRTLAVMVKREGHDVQFTHTLGEGMALANQEDFDAVFLDVQLPDGNGLESLPKIMAAKSRPEVIIMTAQGDPDGAELAIRNGAWDYIEKPSSIKEMTLPFVRALQYRQEKHTSNPMRSLKRDGIIGNSQEILACLDQVAIVASSEGNVLITGETGTGKELFARAIYDNCSRSKERYVVVDCAALPATLVESTLFGYEKGAFTGADKPKEGLIKHADGGTLLLDELGELPFEIQKSFLRVLQERRFRPVGSRREIKSDFRVIGTTNRNLDDMVQKGLFRSDLLYRLRTFSIQLPPLRSRRRDIKEIAMYHMARLCEQYHAGIKGFSPDFLMAISDYNWPGNVRELVNTLEQVLALAGPEPTLFPKHLPGRIRIKIARNQRFKGDSDSDDAGNTYHSSKAFPKLRELKEKTIAQLEKNYLNDLIRHSNGNIKQACCISGIGKSRIYELLKKYHINSPS